MNEFLVLHEKALTVSLFQFQIYGKTLNIQAIKQNSNKKFIARKEFRKKEIIQYLDDDSSAVINFY